MSDHPSIEDALRAKSHGDVLTGYVVIAQYAPADGLDASRYRWHEMSGQSVATSVGLTDLLRRDLLRTRWDATPPTTDRP